MVRTKQAPRNTKAVPKKTVDEFGRDISLRPKKKRGRAKGSRNKNARKDKGTKKGRKATTKPGTKVGELRKKNTYL